MKNYSLILALLLFNFIGCVEYENDPICEEYRFINFEDSRQGIKVEEAHKIKNAGKIYIYEDILLVSDNKEGIHIIDNSDKENPKKIAFLNIPGNIDIAVKDGFLYADSMKDLVVIDIRDLENIQEVNRTKNIFPLSYSNNYSDIAFRCDYDTSKGVIVKGVNNEK